MEHQRKMVKLHCPYDFEIMHNWCWSVRHKRAELRQAVSESTYAQPRTKKKEEKTALHWPEVKIKAPF